MDREVMISRLQGCFLALPTLYRDDLSLNLDGMRQHIDFLIDHGLRVGNTMLLVNGASGEFPVLSLEERLQTVEMAVRNVEGKITTVVGAQTLSTRDAVEIARHAQSIGADALQVSPPFYYRATDDDVYEYLATIAEAAPKLGMVVYNTYWLGYALSREMLERLIGIPQVVGIKWATPCMKTYQSTLLQFADRLSMIDNQLVPVMNRMLGGGGANLHPVNFWPEWGVNLWKLLDDGAWSEAQAEVNRVLLPYYDIVYDISDVTGGEGHIDKLALELIGLPGGRNRPPTRPVPPHFKDRLRQFFLEIGVPLDR